MEEIPFTHSLKHLIAACARFGLIAFILPVTPAILFAISLPATLTLITTTFVIEYGAAPVGVGLGLPPLYVLYVLSCVALGVTLLLLDIFDTLGEHSDRIGEFLERSGARAQQSAILSRYGICGLVPCVMTLGFYVCPPIAWILGWRRDLSILLIMAGYISISVFTILASAGIFSLLVKK